MEYREGLLAVADMPSTHLNLGVLETDLGRKDLAEQAYRKALSMDPYFIPARQNLATIYNQMGRNADAERELREGIRQAPEQGELHYSLGLLLAEGVATTKPRDSCARPRSSSPTVRGFATTSG